MLHSFVRLCKPPPPPPPPPPPTCFNMTNVILFSFADETLYYNVIAGIIAGAVSSAICNPTDVLKVN